MILELIMSAVSSLLKLLFGWISLPATSPDIQAAFDQFLVFLQSGVSFIMYFLPGDLVRALVAVFILIFGFEHLYFLVMWIVKKIPMLGIK